MSFYRFDEEFRFRWESWEFELKSYTAYFQSLSTLSSEESESFWLLYSSVSSAWWRLLRSDYYLLLTLSSTFLFLKFFGSLWCLSGSLLSIMLSRIRRGTGDVSYLLLRKLNLEISLSVGVKSSTIGKLCELFSSSFLN